MPTVRLDELENAAILVEDGEGSAKALVSRETGMIHLLNDDYMDEEAPVPGEVEAGTGGAYVAVPAASELGLGRQLMLRFAGGQLAGERERVADMLGRLDGYERYHGLLEEHGLLDAWMRYRAEHARSALQRWCEEHGLQMEA